MHIESIEISGRYPPLKDVSLDFNSRANVFIGPNGTGKTTLLRCISPQMSDILQSWIDNDGTISRRLSEDWHTLGDDTEEIDLDGCPWIFVPATRPSLPFDNSAAAYKRQIEGSSPTGPQRRTPSVSEVLTNLLKDDLYQFEPLNVYQAVKYMHSRNRGMQLAQITLDAYSCAAAISREIMELDKAPGTYMGLATSLPNHTLPENWEDLDGSQRLHLRNLASPTVTHPAMGIPTTDGESLLFLGGLSSGTQGVFSWIFYLSLKMALFKDFESDWKNCSAILLIDEIENHLHPTWQRRVIPALLEHFPGLQIFATTHSPFVVAGLKAGQVHLLNRDENGVVTATTNTEDIIGWTADEILRSWMGVDEPTDQLTIDRADRLRQLRNQDTLTSEEESELNELRRQVNETFLNKSNPLEEQRKHYADLMQRFLLSRQSDLSQDGG